MSADNVIAELFYSE